MRLLLLAALVTLCGILLGACQIKSASANIHTTIPNQYAPIDLTIAGFIEYFGLGDLVTNQIQSQEPLNGSSTNHGTIATPDSVDKK